VRQDSGQARIKVFIKPMILWLWVGTFVMALGTLLAVLPSRRRFAAGTDAIHDLRDEAIGR
jgi:cytochrome c-type biogenesis protein CcmF